VKNFSCNCGAKIFFENNQCVACHSELGWCPACATMRSIASDGNGQYSCQEPSCRVQLRKCYNYAVENVCNRCFLPNNMVNSNESFCDYCDFNETIPDLSIEGNRQKWRRIEQAKRRLLYTLDLLGVPYGHANNEFGIPLSFDFKGDITKKRILWLFMSDSEQVYTGHSNG
jgi:hypothetical protein